MRKTSWKTRQQEFANGQRKLREFANSDPARQEFLEDLIRRQQLAMDEEELADLPDWVIESRERKRRHVELSPARMRVVESVRQAAQEMTGYQFGDRLWVNSDIELTIISFSLWYQSDSELKIDKDSGRQEVLVRVLSHVAETTAHARAEVNFYSQQFLAGKCNGDLRRYLS